MQLRKPRLAEMTLLTAVVQNPGLVEAHEALARLYKRKFFHNAEKSSRHAQLAVKAGEARKERFHKSVTAAPLAQMPGILARNGAIGAGDGVPLIVVSGLPRSGTSLMMQMLEAAGLPIVSDGKRASDASNPKGYFEDERVKQLPFAKDRSWLLECRGRVVKIVAPLLGCLPGELPCRIIFMERRSEEVLSSQRSMISRGGAAARSQADDAAVARAYAAQLNSANVLLAHRRATEVLPVAHSAALADPLGTAEAVARFLGLSLDTRAMAAVIDKSLYRARA
jgi:hypothetical protein